MIKCVLCKDEPKYNIINIGLYKVKVYDLDHEYGWNLCKPCEFSLNERSYNEYM